MSDAIPPVVDQPAAPAIARSEPIWAKPSISIFALALFLVAFVVAKLTNDNTSVAMLSGAAISMAQSVVGYYLGSSSGSADKSHVISAIAKPPSQI